MSSKCPIEIVKANYWQQI